MAQNAKTEVLFDAPITFILDGPKEEVEVSEKLTVTAAQASEFARKYRESGYGERAVVALADKYQYYYSEAKHYGVVTQLRSWVPQSGPYMPIQVSWLDGRKTDHWPEDLMFIHLAITQDHVKWLMENNK